MNDYLYVFTKSDTKPSEHHYKPVISASMPLINLCLISMERMNRGFIESVTYFGVDKNTGALFGQGESKAEAISSCRRLYKKMALRGDLQSYIKEHKDRLEAFEYDLDEQIREMHKPIRGRKVVDINRPPKERKIPKRALVFQKNDGRCFYCHDELKIEGGWHLEHMIPISRGGSDDLDNLVPSCQTCNLSKHSRTAKEFLEAGMQG
jgi:5-methylcytosine-specific restriction endonuclease McrA